MRLTKDTFFELLDKEEKQLKTRLEKIHGSEAKLSVGKELNARVISYELLGDGYRMVAKSEQGFVVRKVSTREAQLPFKSEIVLSKENRLVNGNLREFIRARAVETAGHTQTFKSRRK